MSHLNSTDQKLTKPMALTCSISALIQKGNNNNNTCDCSCCVWFFALRVRGIMCRSHAASLSVACISLADDVCEYRPMPCASIRRLPITLFLSVARCRFSFFKSTDRQLAAILTVDFDTVGKLVTSLWQSSVKMLGLYKNSSQHSTVLFRALFSTHF